MMAKDKWVDADKEPIDVTYRITFKCPPEYLDAIKDEIMAQGEIIKTEREVVNG
jgi:hypothetical protein